jgi:hypothetical protein
LGAGLTIQPRKKDIVTKHKKGEGQGTIWAVEPHDDDDDDDDDETSTKSRTRLNVGCSATGMGILLP